MHKLDSHDIETTCESFPKLLKNLFPTRFRSVSQARKACRLGEVIRFKTTKGGPTEECEESIDDGAFTNLGELKGLYNIILCSSSSTVMKDDIIAIQSRANYTDSIYPTSSVGYIHPPKMMTSGRKVDLIYEDDLLCLVNKPDLLTTVGEKRNDLQSMLPFLMQPPSKQYWPSMETPPLPRPVHRLDKNTSGLVLVAKTKESMSQLSNSFSSREVKKSYVALVFGRPQKINIGADRQDQGNGELWNTIDHPIDGKASITLWRIVCSIDTEEYGQLTLLLCRPKTGRYHQIRRHLSYCLGTAIVGDSKYDGGGHKEKNARPIGMFLCSNAIEFKYPTNDWAKVSSTVVSTFSSFDDYCAIGLFEKSCNDSVTMVNYENGDDFAHLRAKIPLSEKFRTILAKNKSPLCYLMMDSACLHSSN